MTTEVAPPDLRQQAREMSVDDRVMGPLKGYHHETYAIRLPAGSEVPGGFARAKVRSPRQNLLWFDRRCFRSEEPLLRELYGSVERIPPVIECGGVPLQGFVEGRTLRDGPLSERHVQQLGAFFRQLVAVEHKLLSDGEVERVCEERDRPQDRDTVGFLGRLIAYTRSQAYLRNGKPYATLFADLGVGMGALIWLEERAHTLAPRPFSLIHGDLHRKNFIVDRRDDLWFIDWELAMIGDPLYDLATHLHLMHYGEEQEARITGVWRAAVEDARPASAYGWEQDLPLLLSYKRVQSVYTDVIRAALSLGSGAEPAPQVLERAARRVQGVLAAAHVEFGLSEVPSRQQVSRVLRDWLRTAPPETLLLSAS